MRVTVVVPVYYPGEIWGGCIDAIKMQSLQPDNIVVLDSGLTEKEISLVRQAGFSIISVPQGTFNHGKTRNLALKASRGSDYIVYLTQDAVMADPCALEHIVAPFNDPAVAAVCGRQLPRAGAGPIESHARLFTYQGRSFTRTIKDKNRYGLKTAFLSNSFAAYRLSTLIGIKGFPDDVIFGEDMYVAAKLLKSGFKVAYASDACVYHSHDYSLMQEMKRYFDMGVFHAREPWLRLEFGAAEGEGVKFVTSELGYLLRHAFWRIPEGLIRTVFRYTGFRLGLGERHISLPIKRKLSMSPGYFNK